jgi:hypothetical protein
MSFGENTGALVRTIKRGDDLDDWNFTPKEVDFLNISENPPSIVKISANSSGVVFLDEAGVVYFGGCFAVPGQNETRWPDGIPGNDTSAPAISCTRNGTAEDAIVGSTALYILQEDGVLLSCGE